MMATIATIVEIELKSISAIVVATIAEEWSLYDCALSVVKWISHGHTSRGYAWHLHFLRGWLGAISSH